MDRSGTHNLARQPSSSSVRAFAESSGLDRYDGFPEVIFAKVNSSLRTCGAPWLLCRISSVTINARFAVSSPFCISSRSQYLESLASTRVDLAFLTDSDWNQVLAPLDLKLGKARRVEAAIQQLRVQHIQAQHGAPRSEAKAQFTSEQQRAIEQAEVHNLKSMMTRNARPSLSQQANQQPVRPADLNQPFIPVAYFQGQKPGWVFKHGREGLGYYRDERGRSPGGRGGGGGSGGGSSRSSGQPRTGGAAHAVSRGHDPISGGIMGDAQRRYVQEHEQAVLQQRQQRLEQQMQEAHRQQQQEQQRRAARPSPRSQARAAANQRLKNSPFATD